MKTEQTPEPDSVKLKRGGIPSKQAISLKVQALAFKAIKVWEEALKDPNISIRLGAANRIMDKSVPDVKAMELTGQDNGPLKLIIVKDAQALKSDE